MDEAAEEDDKNALHPQDIDAYWLQRRVAGAFTDIDADRSQKLAEDVLSALAVRFCPTLSQCRIGMLTQFAVPLQHYTSLHASLHASNHASRRL